jgi:hypothetical protein
MRTTYTQGFLLAITLRILEKRLLHLIGPLHLRAVKLLLLGWPRWRSACLKIMMRSDIVGTSDQLTWRSISVATAHPEGY